MRFLLAIGLMGAASCCWSLSPQAKEFMQITQQLEPVQCEKRKLRRAIALAEVESRSDELKALRAKFAALNREPKTAQRERRLAELERQVARSPDPDDLPAISRQQRDAFYRCE